MTWSPEALELRKPRLVALPRSGDRVSFLYLDRVKIWQDDTGVLARNDASETLRIPVASVSVLMLGPGCSITTPATSTIHRAGCSIMTTTDGGITAVTVGRPLAARARWAEAQARMWTAPGGRIAAARVLYADRFPAIDWTAKADLKTMRGLEGHQVKLLYRQHAASNGHRNWHRDTRAEDTPNQLLNLANAILYSSALAAVAAVALNPALGVIHQGSVSALLFDLADTHKGSASIPLAFECAATDQPAHELRRRMRRYLHRNRVFDRHLRLLDQILAPHMKGEDTDRLLDDTAGSVAGHTNYAHDHVEDPDLEELRRLAEDY